MYSLYQFYENMNLIIIEMCKYNFVKGGILFKFEYK